MKYSIRKVPVGTTSVYDRDVWEVLKFPTVGDPYIVATYSHPALARWCLGTFHSSLEVQSMGGSVEEMPAEAPVQRPDNDDTPDELVW